MAYIKSINPNTSDSHQVNSGYLLTVLRWENRDTYNYKHESNITVRGPLVIYNDAIAVSVANTKSSLTPQLSAILKGGDLNYSTAIAPGDFILCNMVSDETKISVGNDSDDTLRNRAVGSRTINRYFDGFKGLFKVQTCRERFGVDPETGTKTISYELHAFGFTEFNNVIYYDPQVYTQFQGNYKMYQQNFNNFWSSIVSKKENHNLQSLLQMLIQALIGQGLKTSSKLNTPEARFFVVPKTVGTLMGIPEAKYACDLYNYIFGIWSPSSSKTVGVASGFNPGIVKDVGAGSSGMYKTPTPLDGRRIMAAEYWNNVKVWSILGSYLNDTINEMYTTYRVNVNGLVMPTVVCRQKPFTSEHFNTNSPVTRFLGLPRWKISPALIYDRNLGRDEAARINFVQIKTRSLAINESKNAAQQTGLGNFVTDIDDIVRNGQKPYLATANFDYPTPESGELKGKYWALLVADWLFGGHLKTAGSIVCAGIEEPISVGDNLEFDGIVYHIEGVQHSMTIDAEGRKSFRTKIDLSFGMDIRSNKDQPVYPEMDHTDAILRKISDLNSLDILPGLTDVENIIGRPDGEKLKPLGEKSFSPQVVSSKPKTETKTKKKEKTKTKTK